MKIAHITTTNMAYMPAWFTHLTNKHTKNLAYLLQEREFIFGNPAHVAPIPGGDLAREILRDADVWHFHGSKNYDRMRFAEIDLREIASGKKIVLHYHGIPERSNPKAYQRRGLPLLVSTPELVSMFAGSRFFPNLIDEEIIVRVATRKPSGAAMPRICHHFSLHRQLKDTELFLLIGNANERFNVIDKMPLDECWRARAQYDAVFDHLQGYYGLVSIEAMAQGVCAINGISENTRRHLIEFFGTMPPFFLTSREGALADMMSLSMAECNARGALGQKYVRDHWSGAQIKRLIEIYEGAA